MYCYKELLSKYINTLLNVYLIVTIFWNRGMHRSFCENVWDIKRYLLVFMPVYLLFKKSHLWKDTNKRNNINSALFTQGFALKSFIFMFLSELSHFKVISFKIATQMKKIYICIKRLKYALTFWHLVSI